MNLKILNIILKIKIILLLGKNLVKENKMILIAKIFHMRINFLEIKKAFMRNMLIQIKSINIEKKRISIINFIMDKITNLFRKIK